MSRLKDHLNSRYFEAANQMTSKKARRRIVAYVESYDDIYFWRTVLGRFEDDKRYFEVMLPSHQKLERGKKSVLMSFIEGRIGEDMIACVDADYDYLLQGVTPQSKKVVESPYVFHTYAYAIENLQCYAPSLHEVCVAVTLNDHRLFDFEDYLTQYSEAIFPLFIWSVWAYRTGRHNQFSLSDMARVIDPGGFNVFDPQPSLDHLRQKVCRKVRQLQTEFPGNKESYLKLKAEADSLLFRAGEQIPVHEFHYWDSSENGTDLLAEKADGRSWRCGRVSDTLYAGFPHLHFGGELPLAERFVKACAEYEKHEYN